jgi:hypothetical protein
MVRLLFTLAAWGVAGLVLIGPVVAVLAMVLSLIVALVATLAPFILLGLLLRLLVVRNIRWQQVRQAGRTAWQSGVVPPARWCAGKLRQPAAWPGLACSTGAAVGRIAWEMMCGALIGAGMGWLLASPLVKKREMVLYVLLACLVGAILGLLVGLANHVTPLRGQTSSS